MSRIRLTRLKQGQDNLDKMKKEIEFGARLVVDFFLSLDNKDMPQDFEFSHITATCRYKFCFGGILYCVPSKSSFYDQAVFSWINTRSLFRVEHCHLVSIKKVHSGLDEFLNAVASKYPRFSEMLDPFLEAAP